jgi:hypothetical protein
MDVNVQLTPHWNLSELLITQNRNFLDMNRNPPQSVVDNLTKFTSAILEPLRVLNNDPLHANSGYRCKDLNHAVGGAVNSQHECGVENGQVEAAADLIDAKNGNLHLFELIRASKLPFDQLITECPDAHGVPAWIHVSWNPLRNRRQVLKARITGHRPDGAPLFAYDSL